MQTIPAPSVLKAQILAYFTTAFPGKDNGTASYFGQWAGVLTEAFLGIYQQIRDAETGAIPSSKTASARLDEFAVLFGLPDGSGTAGRYGRKVATIATGGGATFVYLGAGPFVYTLTAGQQFYAPDGVTLFQTTANVTWAAAGNGTGGGSISSVTKGTAANLSIGTVLSLVSPPAGINNSITLTTATSGAIDTESDSDLLARILDRLQNPPKGGAAADWKSWALGISGVGTAYVYPLRNGTGTVDVVVTQSGSGQSRRVTDADVLTAVEDAIDLVRLVCVEGRRVHTAYMPNSTGHAIRIRATPTTGNAFDWDSSGGALTVSSHTGTTFTPSGAMPADFQAAVTAGSKPRVQFAATGSVLPVQARISSYNAGTHVCTYDVAPTVAPTNGDSVYAGGPIVDQVAADVLAMVDALGPSKRSGYAYDSASWDDTIRVDELIRVAMSAVDSSGTRLVRDLVTDPTIDGSATNVQASDDGANPPEMLYLSGISVTP